MDADPVLDMLLRDVIAHPDDDGPRLAFADRLEETGAGDGRAEFIRVQCELARPARCEWEAEDGAPCSQYNACRSSGRLQLWCPTCAAREKALPQLRHRERWLLAALREALTAELPTSRPECHAWGLYLERHADGIDDEFAVGFARGFAAVVTLPCAAWARHGPALVGAAPLTLVTLSDKEPTGYPASEAVKTHWRWFDGSRADGPDSRDPDELPSALWPFYAAEMTRRRQTWEHPGRADAGSCLSAACLAWARAVTPAGVPA
jgi:uncharacterized protein (TIGR02996 family)